MRINSISQFDYNNQKQNSPNFKGADIKCSKAAQTKLASALGTSVAATQKKLSSLLNNNTVDIQGVVRMSVIDSNVLVSHNGNHLSHKAAKSFFNNLINFLQVAK